MRKPFLSLAILAAAALPAAADDDFLMTSIRLDEIRTIVTDEGYTILSSGNDGVHSVRAKTADGLIFNVVGTVCESGLADGCLGLNMQVRYDADGAETLERINDANIMWAATSVWYTSGGGDDASTPTVGITRYVVLDRGVTRGNIKDNLLNLLAIAPQAADYIWQAGPYAPGASGDAWDDDWDW